MKNSNASLALALLLSFAANLPAQQAEQSKLEKEASQAMKRVVKEVDYREYSLSVVVQDLRTQFPEVNFIVGEKVEKLIIRLQMRNVTLPNILEALRIAGGNHLLVDQPDNMLITFALDQRAIDQENADSKKPVVRAFNLAGYFGDAPPEKMDGFFKQFTELLEETAQLYRRASPTDKSMEMPQFKLHFGTKMLIVVGSDESMRILDEIVYSLPGMERPQKPSTR